MKTLSLALPWELKRPESRMPDSWCWPQDLVTRSTPAWKASWPGFASTPGFSLIPPTRLFTAICCSTRSPSLVAPDSVVPATFHAIRPSLPALTGAEQIPDWVGNLRKKKRPVVYGTLGTIFNKHDDVLAAMLAALSANDEIEVVVTIGKDREVSEFGPVPDHVRVVQYIPLAALMPHLDLVVSHGGSGTLTAALAYGLPQVVLPMNADQPENAQRVAALGAGIVVDGNEPSPEGISAAVRAALSDPAYRAGARRVQSEIAQLPDVEQAVPLLQRI